MVRYKVFELKSFLNSFIIYGHYENHFYIFNHTHMKVNAENFSITKILWLLLLLGSENKLLITKKLKILIKKKSKMKILDPQKLQITMIMKGCRKDFNPQIWPNIWFLAEPRTFQHLLVCGYIPCFNFCFAHLKLSLKNGCHIYHTEKIENLKCWSYS